MRQDDQDEPRIDTTGVAVLLSRLQDRIDGHREVTAVVVVLVAALFMVRGWHGGTHEFLAAGLGLLLVARAVLLGRPLTAVHVGLSALLIVAAEVADVTGHLTVGWLTVVGAGAVVGLPRRAPAPGTAEERRHLWALVDATPADTLAPFVLRSDKSYVFSPDRAAAVAYRVRFGMAIAAGDPVGAADSHHAAIEAFITAADANGWRPAALGVSERALPAWRERGMRGVPIGRDVVLDVATFSMQGRSFRNLRQAVQRSRNAGVTTEIVAERDLSDAERAELEQVIRADGRGHQVRGFAMILDHVLDGTHPGMLVAVARDRGGRAIAFQRYATADGGRELSLDVPWRVAGAPNGVDERLIADVVAWAGERGGVRVSLTFAAFPELFASKDRGLLQETTYRAVRLLDRFIRLESLYRFVRKFHAFDARRYVVLRPTQVLWVAFAALSLEFGKPRRGNERRSH
jgi:lysylphosphatidylglycerol synthetase-like protein (DUF2156 family)